MTFKDGLLAAFGVGRVGIGLSMMYFGYSYFSDRALRRLFRACSCCPLDDDRVALTKTMVDMTLVLATTAFTAGLMEPPARAAGLTLPRVDDVPRDVMEEDEEK